MYWKKVGQAWPVLNKTWKATAMNQLLVHETNSGLYELRCRSCLGSKYTFQLPWLVSRACRIRRECCVYNFWSKYSIRFPFKFNVSQMISFVIEIWRRPSAHELWPFDVRMHQFLRRMAFIGHNGGNTEVCKWQILLLVTFSLSSCGERSEIIYVRVQQRFSTGNYVYLKGTTWTCIIKMFLYTDLIPPNTA